MNGNPDGTYIFSGLGQRQEMTYWYSARTRDTGPSDDHNFLGLGHCQRNIQEGPAGA